MTPHFYTTIRFVRNACGLFVFMWARAGVETYEIETLGLDGVE